jgi:hypothetical protein
MLAANSEISADDIDWMRQRLRREVRHGGLRKIVQHTGLGPAAISDFIFADRTLTAEAVNSLRKWLAR